MAKPADNERSYKELSDELADLLAELEEGELEIETAVARYERGLQIVKQLEAFLTTAENRVTELKASLGQDQEEE